MEETTYLKQKIKDCRHKLNLAKILENCVYYISFGALAAVLVEGISLFVPFYYANYFAAGCIGIGCLVGIVRAVMTWADEKAAARKLDSFGLQERTLTAYENLDKEDAFTKLQRNDAVQMLKENENNICIPIRPNTRHLLAFIFSLVCVCTLAMVPSVAKEQAKELHALKQEVKEKKKLQELMKSLEMSKKELDQVESAQELASANERLQFKYQETVQSLTGIDPSKIGVKEAQQIAQAASGQTGGSSNGNDTAGANGQLADGSNNNGDSQSSSGDGNNENNTSGDGNLTENGNGDGDGDGNGNGNGQGNGDGNGSGSGNGNGQGNGNGNGNGNGSGSGKGSGRGTGSSSTAHDYVTVPNKVGDDSSLHGDKTGKNNSDYYRAQNGLTWEGDHVSLDSVIADYTKNAYEGISSGRYPSGMENVIKDYFKNLNE